MLKYRFCFIVQSQIEPKLFLNVAIHVNNQLSLVSAYLRI